MPMSTSRTTERVRSTYQFIKSQQPHYSVTTLCRVIEVAPSGYYAWLKRPVSAQRGMRPKCSEDGFDAIAGRYDIEPSGCQDDSEEIPHVVSIIETNLRSV